jgi:hypothetical protein
LRGARVGVCDGGATCLLILILSRNIVRKESIAIATYTHAHAHTPKYTHIHTSTYINRAPPCPHTHRNTIHTQQYTNIAIHTRSVSTCMCTPRAQRSPVHTNTRDRQGGALFMYVDVWMCVYLGVCACAWVYVAMAIDSLRTMLRLRMRMRRQVAPPSHTPTRAPRNTNTTNTNANTAIHDPSTH